VPDIDDDRRSENAVLAGAPASGAVSLRGAAAHRAHPSGKIMMSTYVDATAAVAGPGADREPTI
jgi:aspartate 1-decarboxylase